PVVLVIRPQVVKPKVEILPSELRAPLAKQGELTSTPDLDVPQIPPPPDFTEGKTFETDDDDPHEQAKGSPTGTSLLEGMTEGAQGRKPGAGPGKNIAMGAGGGSGDTGVRFGGPFGGRHKHYVRFRQGRYGSAVEEGLRWLARHQAPDGHWSSDGFHALCQGAPCKGDGYSEFDVGNTGLALLAFLGAGFTPQNHETYIDPVTKKPVSFGDTVRKATQWLIDKENADGCIRSTAGEMMYNQAIATLALCEAYGLTNAVSYCAPAQRAVNFLTQVQNYGLGWRYTPRCGDNDTSVTGWCVMALKSAQISGLKISQTSFQGARAWIDRVTEANGTVGYDRLGSGEVCVPGKNEQWLSHPSMTAVGVLCRIFIDKDKKDKRLEAGARILMDDLPKWDTGAKRPSVDFYYWYYATLALWQLDGPDGARWKQWNAVTGDMLCKHQHTSKDGCQDGSWDVDQVDRWGHAGGRVYGAAINVLTLETSFRYESVFGAGRRDGK
ncbi:MAG TPA: prenyltransferase/squalene oxidase repeat-containing protein, partial [Planctomycetota bacterium]|nr:prenyltransferase/squalene oxidase repeat-containing protein [Planctomycetota bacterium]